MIIILAHKIKLNPTPEQEKYFWRAAGIARFAFNWGLAEYNFRSDYNRKVIKAGIGDKVPISGRLLKKEFNKVKPDWVSEVTTWAYQGAFDDLQTAFTNYWRKLKNGELKPPPDYKPRKDGRPFGWPRFKSRNKSTPSFYQANQSMKFDGYNVRLPIIGWVNMSEQLRFDGKVMGGRVAYYANQWWLSVQIEIEIEPPANGGDAIELDLGIKYLAVTSDGEKYNNPKQLSKTQRKLARLQRKLARQQAGSNNREKTKRAIAKLHYKIKCIRDDAAHKMTTEITKKYSRVIIEDLSISDMLHDNDFAAYLADAALYEKRRQLEYKAELNGSTLEIVDQFLPTNKMCNHCRYNNDGLRIGQLTWICPTCGAKNDKYENSLKNIKGFNDTRRTTQAESLNGSTLT